MVWYGMAWHGMAWHGMVWYGMVWYGMVWYCVVLYDPTALVIVQKARKNEYKYATILYCTFFSQCASGPYPPNPAI